MQRLILLIRRLGRRVNIGICITLSTPLFFNTDRIHVSNIIILQLFYRSNLVSFCFLCFFFSGFNSVYFLALCFDSSFDSVNSLLLSLSLHSVSFCPSSVSIGSSFKFFFVHLDLLRFLSIIFFDPFYFLFCILSLLLLLSLNSFNLRIGSVCSLSFTLCICFSSLGFDSVLFFPSFSCLSSLSLLFFPRFSRLSSFSFLFNHCFCSFCSLSLFFCLCFSCF